ncbi:MAG: 1-acyl-sn-glycerol-3-phosphate acyltransferase [Burkholderiales bacterium]
MSTPPPATNRLDAPLALGARARLAWRALHLAGWHVVLARPVPMKCVIVFYPHTSNWDFPVGLAAKWSVGVHFRFVAKDSLFASPLGPLFRRWGGIPVNRRESTGFVGQMRAALEAHDDFRLVIAPEGTRSRTDHWKSGFWHLARAARVPIGLGFIDYARREVGIGAWIDATDDAAADMARIADFYADKTAARPALAGPVRLRSAGEPRRAVTDGAHPPSAGSPPGP